MDKNIKTEKPYTQVCVWPACYVFEDGMTEKQIKSKIVDFEEFMLKNLKARVKFLEQITTTPDGYLAPDSGGRIDIFFGVHSEDIPRFAILRLEYEMRWIEDVLDNEIRRGADSIYPARVKGYRTW